MSILFRGHPLAPRRGGPLRVLLVCRISTDHQDARSLDDQAAFCREFVRRDYPGEVAFEVISGRGSGELLDHDDLRQAERAAESGRFDLVVVEDLGRICRRGHAQDFCEACEDSGTRFIAVNDSLDTAAGNWRLNALFAAFKHESGNADTSKRIRRSLRNRFAEGGVVMTLPYGYRKPPGARSDADIERLPEAGPVIERVFALLEGGASYAEVADWLNAEGVPLGSWIRVPKWDCRVVGRLVRNPILKGERLRNVKKSVRVNKTGRRRSVAAPAAERLSRFCPNLAFVEPERYDRLMARLDGANGHFARGRAEAGDRREGVSRKRTAWPGQHAVCGVCGRLFYWGGHGRAGHLMCSGARDYACWVAATFDGAAGAARLAAALLAAVEALPEFDAAFRAEAEAAARARAAAYWEALRGLDAALAAADREVENLVDAVARVGHSAALARRLAEAEGHRSALAAERAERRGRTGPPPDVPAVEVLKARARRLLASADFADPELYRDLCALAPRVELFPVQLLDGGAVELRARLVLRLAHLGGAGGGPLPERTVWADLFDPPQRAALRPRVAALRAAGRSERAVAAELGITQPAVQAAGKLHRRMAERGLADPYAVLTAPPDGGRKNARHGHPRYAFAPLPGYPADPAA